MQDIPSTTKQLEFQLIICTKVFKVFYILQCTHRYFYIIVIALMNKNIPWTLSKINVSLYNEISKLVLYEDDIQRTHGSYCKYFL